MTAILFMDSFFRSVAKSWPNGVTEAIATQFTHVGMFGLRAYDLVFPTFLFLAGCSWPFSLESQREKGVPTREIVKKILRRLFLLLLVGAIIQGPGLLSFDFMKMRLNSILGHIGVGWAVVAFVTLFFRRRWWLVAIGILAAYWLGYLCVGWFVNPPGMGAWVSGRNLNSLFDHWLFSPWPGKWENVYSDIGCVASAFLGYVAGSVLRNASFGMKRKLLVLLLGAAGCGALTLVSLASGCPISKPMWNPSYIFVAAAADFAALAFLFAVIDLWRVTFWTKLFTVVGANALFAYVLIHYVSFTSIAHRFLCGVEGFLAPAWTAPLDRLGGFAILWLLLYHMYRRNVYVRL